MKKRKPIILLVVFICIACNNSIKQEYFYENGVSLQKDTLYVGEKIYLRVKPKSSLKDLNIGCTNGVIQNADNKDLYDFMIIPAHKGILKLYFFYTGDGGIDENTITQTFIVILQVESAY